MLCQIDNAKDALIWKYQKLRTEHGQNRTAWQRCPSQTKDALTRKMNRKRTEQGQNRAAEEQTNCRKYAEVEQNKNREQNNINAEKWQNEAGNRADRPQK